VYTQCVFVDHVPARFFEGHRLRRLQNSKKYKKY
jgi:hypothetical protein